MSEVDFSISFFIYLDKVKTFGRGDMQIDEDGIHTVELDTAGMGTGAIQYQIDVTLPDGRLEKVRGTTTGGIVSDGLH